METPQASVSPAANPIAALNQFTRRGIHPHIAAQCRNLFFRQSFINDYLDCSQMALYRWVLNLDQAPPFMSATLGTAGHAVAFRCHVSRKYDYTYFEILEMLEDEFNKQIAKDRVYPTLPKGCDTPAEAFSLKGPEYAKLLFGYQFHPRNRAYHSTFHEQSFVLELPGPDGENYLFTGQIDQGGYYDDGMLSVRDFKFRDDAFRPSKVQLDLNVQATIYCAAVRFGKPACEKCRPRHERDEIENTIKLIYNGPCDSCSAKIGTPLWPMKYPNLFEFIWMKDFNTHDKDQYETTIIDRDLPKIPNPNTGGKGQKVYQRVPNPEYDSGYKKGDFVGPCFLPTLRPPSVLSIMMSNVLDICDQIKKGVFYRKPGESCNFWCKSKESCLKGMELDVQEAALDQVTAIGTEDPW